MIISRGEIKMNKIKNIIAVSAFTLMVMALPAVVSAQYGNNGGYYPNGGYNNGGRYGGNLENVADRLKNRSRDFERQVDREFNSRGRYGNTSILGTILGGGGINNRGYGNDNIKRLAEDFRRAANDFENRTDDNDNGRYNNNDRYNDDDRYNDGRNGRNGQWGRGDARDQQSAQRLLSIGSQLENELRRMRMSSTLQRQWSAIRSDLNIVASTYGRGGRNGRYPF